MHEVAQDRLRPPRGMAQPDKLQQLLLVPQLEAALDHRRVSGSAAATQSRIGSRHHAARHRHASGSTAV